MSTKAKQAKPVQWEGVITNIQERALVALAQHKFMTLSQLLLLDGIGTTQYKYLWKQVSSLRDRQRPLVKCQRFNAITPAKSGLPPERVEDLYYLSKEGEKALRNDLQYEGIIKRPIGRRLAYKDYRHRKDVISFQVHLGNWIRQNELKLSFFHTYFDKEGNNRKDANLRAKTRVDFEDGNFFIPDAAFKIVSPQKQKWYLFEMYRGHDPKRTINQLHQHGLAMAKRYTHASYDIPSNKAYYIVLLFERESLKQSVLERIQQHEPAFELIEKYFRVKSWEDIAKGNFEDGWLTLYDSSVALF